jgi:hypothetical protein
LLIMMVSQLVVPMADTTAETCSGSSGTSRVKN